MEHELLIEYRNGCYEARCGCGGWRHEPTPLRVGRLREVYGRLESEHGRHVEEIDGAVALGAGD